MLQTNMSSEEKKLRSLLEVPIKILRTSAPSGPPDISSLFVFIISLGHYLHKIHNDDKQRQNGGIPLTNESEWILKKWLIVVYLQFNRSGLFY